MPPSASASLLSIAVLGFLLGMRHATDPDHLVAVTTIVARERSFRGASLLGAVWGAGHTVTILVVGGAIVVFGVVIPPRAGLVMELAVALMLVLLGALSLIRIARALRHGHHHATGAPHDHGEPRPPDPQQPALYRLGRPLVAGVVHGLAGSAGIALLVLGTIRSPAWAVGYLLLFSLGTVAGMTLITGVIALPFAYTARRFERINDWLGAITGLGSVVFGVILVYQIAFVAGLFGDHPSWKPD